MSAAIGRVSLASLTLALCVSWSAPARPAAAKTGEELTKELYFLYVQSGNGGSFDGKRLTLDSVGSTLFFADRPARVSGHMDTANFLKAWGPGADSFAADPPNATLSILEPNATTNAVVELREPKLEGSNVSYAVKVIDGKIPAKFGTASLFIDHHSGGNAGDYIAAGLGGAVLGGALMHASDESSKPQAPAQPSYVAAPVYAAPGYYYRAQPPVVCNCGAPVPQ
jgi:hypothetical protein